MAEILKRKKPLAVNPLKSSQTIGAALAFLGVDRSIPMLHGSQGCSAFGKVFFVRHFREPIPLQTTAMDQVSAVMGSYENVVEGLNTIAVNSAPDLIGLPTTGLSETQGCDIRMALNEFRQKYPEHADLPIVPVNTPDYVGCLETGFAVAVQAMLEELVKPSEEGKTKAGKRKNQVNILASAHLTPGDIEELKEIVELFGLRPVVFPDLSLSLDGHLPEEDYSTLTTGGQLVSEVRTLDEAIATIAIGPSIFGSAEWLEEKTGVPSYKLDHVFGLKASDRLVMLLSELSEQPVPPKIDRQRAQYQDAMLDCHFMTGLSRAAVAGDPDLLGALDAFLTEMGIETVAAVAPSFSSSLKALPIEAVQIGDLEDLETMAQAVGVDVIVSNSHAALSAERLGKPLLRAGFPQWDVVGGYQKCWVGYRGGRQILFELANLMLSAHPGHIKPYQSIYGQKLADERKEEADERISKAISG